MEIEQCHAEDCEAHPSLGGNCVGVPLESMQMCWPVTSIKKRKRFPANPEKQKAHVIMDNADVTHVEAKAASVVALF